jgi:pyruvate ferredoxin oxidoreductase gamma subunit
MVVVLDHLLLTEVDVAAGLKPGGLIVLNTPKQPSAYDFGDSPLAVADVNALSVAGGAAARPRERGQSTGWLCRAFDEVPFDLVVAGIEAEVQGQERAGQRSGGPACVRHTIVGEA